MTTPEEGPATPEDVDQRTREFMGQMFGPRTPPAEGPATVTHHPKCNPRCVGDSHFLYADTPAEDPATVTPSPERDALANTLRDVLYPRQNPYAVADAVVAAGWGPMGDAPAEGPATVTLTAKWRDASEAARKSQHHFPADCLAEAALVVETLTADLAAAEQARDDWHITARTMLEQRDDAEQVIANVRALYDEWESTGPKQQSTRDLLFDLGALLSAASTGEDK